MILIGALDAPLAFVAKRAFEQQRDHPSPDAAARRRPSSIRQSARPSAKALDDLGTARIEEGEILVVFVEGTFVRAPGPASASSSAPSRSRRGRTVVPVVPLTIDGSRELLRDEQWWMRRTSDPTYGCRRAVTDG